MSEAKYGQQVTNLVPLKQAAKVKHGDSAYLQRRRNLVQATVGPTQDRLVAKPHPRALKLTDACPHSLGFIIQRLETAKLGMA